jgi:hypothetical protein
MMKMIKETNASAIYRCPKTNEQLSYDETMDSRGICPRCGSIDGFSITHRKIVSGHWWMPTFWERLKGIKPEFEVIESKIE